MNLFRTKPINADMYCDTGLRRCLSAFDLTMLGIGAIIGAGIFVLTGIAAATKAGPAIVLSFVLAGFACAFAALAYAELAAAVGGCGSAYGYAYAGFGEFIAWIIGWDLLLEYGVATAAVAIGWSGYLNNALTAMGMPLPVELTRSPAGRGARQSRRGGGDTGAGGTAGRRHPLQRTLQRRHGADQAQRDRGLHRGRLRPRRPCQLDPPSPLRLGGCGGRRGADLLRLHRLRRRIDRRGGGGQSAARRADRHHRLARRMHRDLHPRLRAAHRHRPLPHAQRRLTGGGLPAAPRPPVGLRGDRGRGDRGPDHGDAGVVLRPHPNLPRDVARRTAAAGHLAHPPGDEDSGPHHPGQRRGHGRHRRIHSDRRRRGAGQHRHAGRLRAGVRRRHRAAPHPSRPAAPVPQPVDAGCTAARHRLLPCT
jgi:hypothetical protein